MIFLFKLYNVQKILQSNQKCWLQLHFILKSLHKWTLDLTVDHRQALKEWKWIQCFGDYGQASVSLEKVSVCLQIPSLSFGDALVSASHENWIIGFIRSLNPENALNPKTIAEDKEQILVWNRLLRTVHQIIIIEHAN